MFAVHIIALFFPIFLNFQNSEDEKHKDEAEKEAEGGEEVDGKW